MSVLSLQTPEEARSYICMYTFCLYRHLLLYQELLWSLPTF